MAETSEAELSAEIAATPARIWDLVRSFGTVAVWHPIATASRILPPGLDEPGCEREIEIAGGGRVLEKLVGRDEAARRLIYRMLTFPIPVSAQENEIRVEASRGDQARVVFRARFTPAPGHDAEEVRAANVAAFQLGVEGLTRALLHSGATAGTDVGPAETSALD